MKAGEVRAALRALGTPAKAKDSARFFKTGPGQYSEGDTFIGVSVPEQRAAARRFKGLSLAEAVELLKSKVHEERLTALILMVGIYERGDAAVRARVVKAYLANLKWVNNWDLVDSSAAQILGDWLLDRDRSLLDKLVKSKNLWRRRLAMVATFQFILAGEHKDTFRLAGMLLDDEHDLMHKAVGWMLREVGKRVSRKQFEGFLNKNAARMPRTAIRYAIEHFSEPERRRWMALRP